MIIDQTIHAPCRSVLLMVFLHSYILLFFNRSDHESPRQHPGSVLPLKGVSYHRWTRPPVCGLRRRGRRSRITTSLVWGRLGRWGASQRSIRRKRKRSNIVTKGFKQVATFFLLCCEVQIIDFKLPSALRSFRRCCPAGCQ